MRHTFTALAGLILLTALCWQLMKHHQQAELIRQLRNQAIHLQGPEQIDDSTQVAHVLQGEVLERDRIIERLKRDLDASTRMQMDMRLHYEADLARLETQLEMRLDESTAEPLNDSLTRYEVPFTLSLGDTSHSASVEGTVAVTQPGPEYLPTIGVQLRRLQIDASVEIDLVEDKAGCWQSIVRTSTSCLRPAVSVAVCPRQEPWYERIQMQAGLGVRDGIPQVFGGVLYDPWGVGITAGGGVGVFVCKTF